MAVSPRITSKSSSPSCLFMQDGRAWWRRRRFPRKPASCRAGMWSPLVWGAPHEPARPPDSCGRRGHHLRSAPQPFSPLHDPFEEDFRMTEAQATYIPEGYMRDPRGNLVPEANIKPIDRMRHDMVM